MQAGQFIGARADFVPDQICRQLCLLQDQVPPMSPARAKQVSTHHHTVLVTLCCHTVLSHCNFSAKEHMCTSRCFTC
jgi:hypothetical protein